MRSTIALAFLAAAVIAAKTEHEESDHDIVEDADFDDGDLAQVKSGSDDDDADEVVEEEEEDPENDDDAELAQVKSGDDDDEEEHDHDHDDDEDDDADLAQVQSGDDHDHDEEEHDHDHDDEEEDDADLAQVQSGSDGDHDEEEHVDEEQDEPEVAELAQVKENIDGDTIVPDAPDQSDYYWHTTIAPVLAKHRGFLETSVNGKEALAVQIGTHQADLKVMEYAKQGAMTDHAIAVCLLKRQQAMEVLYNCQLNAIKHYVATEHEGHAAGQAWLNAKDTCYEAFNNSQDCASAASLMAAGVTL